MPDLLMIVPIGDTGEEMAVTVEWTPDPRMIEARMVEAANNFDDWSIPLEEARQIMIQNTREHFDYEIDPYGHDWAPLNEEYLFYKQRDGYPDNILERTGKLKEAATSEANWVVTGNSLFFNTSALPKNDEGVSYGEIHQEGSGQLSELAGQALDIMALRSAGATNESLTPEQAKALGEFSEGAGKGKNLPRRMFIGADLLAIEAIEKVFLDFLDATVTDYIDWVAPIPTPGSIVTTSAGIEGTLTNIPSFGGGFLVRGAGGRFVKGTFGR